MSSSSAQPRRTGRASADVATGRGGFSRPRGHKSPLSGGQALLRGAPYAGRG